MTPHSRYETQVLAALGAIGVRAPGGFVWFGRHEPAGCPTRESLVDAIAQRLHADFYGPGMPRPVRAGPVTPADDTGAFVRALSQANCSRGSWQAGWRVAAVDGDTIAVVAPAGLQLVAPSDACRAEGAVRAGAPAEVRLPKERLGLSPGFYVAEGDTPSPAVERMRMFWSVSAPGAVTFVARATYALNGAGVPFRLQLLDNPARFEHRAGGAAIVLARTDFAAAAGLLRPLLRTLGPHLSDGAPAFTKPLARGLAVAEEPADGPGFGEDRCHLLAGAVVAASERGLRTDEQRLAVVREHAAAAGLSLDAPYLQPGSDDAYDPA